jgi:hypothetical protein
MKRRLKFDVVVQILREQQKIVVEKLRTTRADPVLLETKRQLDRSIKCLTFCENHQIHPDCEVLALPWPRDHFGEFLVVDVDETGGRSNWSPAAIDGKAVTLDVGDIVIKQGHSFNLPPDDMAACGGG